MFGGLLARIMLLLMALAPLPLAGQPLIWLVITLGVIRSAAGNLAFPAWMSITGDIVPMEGRGRYFGSRNFVMVIASIAVTYLMGEFITRVGSLQGYQLALGLSFLTGMVSTWFFWQIQDTAGNQPVQSEMKLSLGEVWQDFRASPLFFQFCLVMAVWNLALNVAGPFFNVYMAQELGFTAAMIGVATIASSVTRVLTQRKIGELADRWGPARVQWLGMLLIPVLPILWMFARELWHVLVINALAGVFWGAFELASFNFLLVFMPEQRRARFSAIFSGGDDDCPGARRGAGQRAHRDDLGLCADFHPVVHRALYRCAPVLGAAAPGAAGAGNGHRLTLQENALTQPRFWAKGW